MKEYSLKDIYWMLEKYNKILEDVIVKFKLREKYNYKIERKSVVKV